MGKVKQNKAFIGLDIGGTKIEGIFWAGGKVVRFQKIKTPQTKKSFLSAVFHLIDEVASGQNFAGIGVACAGAIDFGKGTILNSPNLAFLNGLNLEKLIHKRFSRPARLDNDTNCFLLSEARFGQARGKRHVVALTLGTGVGGAVLADGILLRGSHGSAGELGHLWLAAEKGRFLSLEDLVSKHGFRRFGVSKAREFQDLAEAGNKKALSVFHKIGEYLGVGLASLVNVFDPEMIILGGSIAKSKKLLTAPAAEMMKKYSLIPPAKLPPIKISKLEHAGALGAVSLFL
jgi:glucokinase